MAAGAGLAEEVPAPIDNAGYAWCTGEDGGVPMLRATMVGLAHIAVNERTSPDSALSGTVAETAVEVPATTGTDAEGALIVGAPSIPDLSANLSHPERSGRRQSRGDCAVGLAM
jgi:hypothetical protein